MADTHTLTVFRAVDVPEDVQQAVIALLSPYDVDAYDRDCDNEGRAL